MITEESETQVKNWVHDLQFRYKRAKLQAEEIFVDVKGYEGLYKISNHGKVFGIKKGYILRVGNNGKYKHKFVNLYKSGKSRKYYIHRLVLIHFDREPLFDEECRHLDGNAENNHISNLKWGTSLENQKDRFVHGRTNRGENQGLSKLLKSQVEEIRNLYKIGKYNQKELSKIFNVSNQHISRIVNYVEWGHI